MTNNVKITGSETFSPFRYKLHKITYEYINKQNEKETMTREVYDRGNGAGILLYNKEMKTVVLTRQFRLPSFVNGNASGMLVEVCAGQLDHDSPEDCIRRESEEETGYKIQDVTKVYEAYMSPGSVSEMLYLFIGAYTKEMKQSEGGGVDRGEDIDVLEMRFDEAMKMMEAGEIKDGKTIMLLQYAWIKKIFE
ncbi:NUDIX domain-containing protein [Chitinophagaceae bacterium 26-R-25]|nr:NUDIX domain-containing protein [Chitinophagaceae bacterium 26-R-25]